MFFYDFKVGLNRKQCFKEINGKLCNKMCFFAIVNRWCNEGGHGHEHGRFFLNYAI